MRRTSAAQTAEEITEREKARFAFFRARASQQISPGLSSQLTCATSSGSAPRFPPSAAQGYYDDELCVSGICEQFVAARNPGNSHRVKILEK